MLPSSRPTKSAVTPNLTKFSDRVPLDTLWHSGSPEDWHNAKGIYWAFVKPHLMMTEVVLNDFDPAYVRNLSPKDWYDFLRTQYFPWKYTAPNRLATTTAQLQTYASTANLDELFEIKEALFTLDLANTRCGLELATGIRGLGVAGASGLLALLFPSEFGTVDQFAVKALRSVSGLDDKAKIECMNSERLTVNDGALLIRLMREKATDLNQHFATTYWTPRKLDMVLWTYGR